MSTHHEMKELPISSTNYLIKVTELNAELLNKSVMLQWLIIKLLKGKKTCSILQCIKFAIASYVANRQY